MKYTEEQISKVCRLKHLGINHRRISYEVFGKTTAASSVHAILSKHYYNGGYKAEPKILIGDIETSPILGYVWGLWNQNLQIDRIREDWITLTWAAKWLTDDEIYHDSIAEHGYKGGGYKKDNHSAERKVVESVWHMLDKCDIFIAHNGKKFDKKKMNAKFLFYGLGEPSPYKVIDTLDIVKKNFALTSNKLDYVTQFLGGEGKLDTGGFRLWLDFMDGCPEAQKKMLDYNIQDVTELESTWLDLRGWDAKSPNLALYYNDNEERCNKCGSTELEELKNKFAYTNLSQFQVKQCTCCGGYVRGRDTQLDKEKRQSLNMNIL